MFKGLKDHNLNVNIDMDLAKTYRDLRDEMKKDKEKEEVREIEVGLGTLIVVGAGLYLLGRRKGYNSGVLDTLKGGSRK